MNCACSDPECRQLGCKNLRNGQQQHQGPWMGQQQPGPQQFPFGLNPMGTPSYILDILYRLERIESKLNALAEQTQNQESK